MDGADTAGVLLRPSKLLGWFTPNFLLFVFLLRVFNRCTLELLVIDSGGRLTFLATLFASTFQEIKLATSLHLRSLCYFS